MNTTGFKKHFTYGEISEQGTSITDSWIRNEDDLIDLRDLKKGTKEVMLELWIGKKSKRIIFSNRKEGLKYIKKEFGLK